MTRSVNPLQQLREAFDQLWHDFVDPREALAGEDGTWWTQLGTARSSASVPLAGERLADLRQQCRELMLTNQYAINGIENRISYLVGPGHSYRATVRRGAGASESLASEVQQVIDRFLEENQWHDRQQEIVRRLDRDGEVFLRFFTTIDGATRVRFVEPDDVATPVKQATNPAASFGILTQAGDVETVLGYYVGDTLVPASDIQHRRANVDRNVKRGLPLYAPVRANLRRAEKLLRNMSVVAEIQSAIALIRKHRGASRSGVEQFVSDTADATLVNGKGHLQRVSQYGPGTILDAPAGLEYDFPATGINAATFVTILQAELRAIAARLVMPEFMFSSDASNANYASTMVAEGPALRMFERLQHALQRDDLEVLWRVLQSAAGAGQLPANIRQLVDLQAVAPPLASRDALRDARVCEIAFQHGLLSRQTWSQRLGLDYDQEQANLAAE